MFVLYVKVPKPPPPTKKILYIYIYTNAREKYLLFHHEIFGQRLLRFDLLCFQDLFDPTHLCNDQQVIFGYIRDKHNPWQPHMLHGPDVKGIQNCRSVVLF